VNTLALHFTDATIRAACDLRNARSLATVETGGQAVGAMGIIFVALIATFLAMMVKAARGMAALISEFLRLAASITTVLFTLLIAVVLALVWLVHA
jgi:hypothetical protein